MVGQVRFGAGGAARLVYLTILASHTLLAMLVPVLLALTLLAARREAHPRHRLMGRVTLLTWMYVSVTGVVVYVMLRPYSRRAEPTGARDGTAPPLPPRGPRRAAVRARGDRRRGDDSGAR